MDKPTVSLQLLPLLQWSSFGWSCGEGGNVVLIRNIVNLGSGFLTFVKVVINLKMAVGVCHNFSQYILVCHRGIGLCSF